MKLKDACSWKESYGNLDCILESKDITLPTKVHMVKAMVFPVVMYRYEIWTIKKAECQRIDAFIVVLEKTLESPLDWKENQSILKETSPEYSFMMLKLKLQYFGHLVWRTDLLEKILMLGKIEGQRRRGWLDSITDSMDMNFGKVLEIVRDREGWHAAVHGVVNSQTQQSDCCHNNNNTLLHI